MPSRSARAEWWGDLENGEGKIEFGEGRFEEAYDAVSRFEDGTSTNPEELIAAAQAACYSMALSNVLNEAGKRPERIEAEATARLEREDGGFRISRIDLRVLAEVPDIDEDAFLDAAEEAKESCPVSKALAGCKIELDARLI